MDGNAGNEDDEDHDEGRFERIEEELDPEAPGDRLQGDRLQDDRLYRVTAYRVTVYRNSRASD